MLEGDLEAQDLLFLDVETTGLNAAGGDRIVEICAIHCRGGVRIETLETLVDPGRAIPEDATRIHGIDTEMLRGAPEEAEVMRRLSALLVHSTLIAHNARFDLSFVDDALNRQGHAPVARRAIDTLAWSRRLWVGDRRGHSLAALAARLNLTNPNPHRARGDVEVLFQAWPRLLRALAKRAPADSLEAVHDFLRGGVERRAALAALATQSAIEVVHQLPRGRTACTHFERFGVADDLLVGEGPEGELRLPFHRVLKIS